MKKIILVICFILISSQLAFANEPSDQSTGDTNTIHYTYDEVGRLTKVEYGNGSTIEYVYDSGGNILSVIRVVPEEEEDVNEEDEDDSIIEDDDDEKDDEVIEDEEKDGEDSPKSEIRIAGADRYFSAYEIAKRFNEKPERVLIVRGDEVEEMPQIIDGLTASGLAGVKNAPILLVRQDRLPEGTLMALMELDPDEAWIIGGVEAISESVGKEIEALGIQTQRIAGVNRYETAAKIALEMGSANGNIGIITNGNNENLVDSLTAGPLALQGHPILLVNNQRGMIPDCTLDAINELGIDKLIIIGGTSAVSQSIEDALAGLENVSVLTRLGGEDRYETSALVAQLENFDGVDYYSLVNGYGTRYVDAVAASTLGAPILYFNGHREEIPPSVIEALRLKENFRAIGGPAVTPDSVIEQASEVIGSLITSVQSGFINAYTGMRMTFALKYPMWLWRM